MNILLITNRHPKDRDDIAAPFVPDFVRALTALGMRVTISTPLYGRPPAIEEPGVCRFGFGPSSTDTPIGSWNMLAPRTWWRIHRFIHAGEKAVDEVMQRSEIDHILALWALPSGWFARYAARKWRVPYSIWCLGSDINDWARRPFVGILTRKILRNACLVFADGFALAKAATKLSGKHCCFLPSFRQLADTLPSDIRGKSNHQYFLYAGRIHRNKGVFDLLAAFNQAGSQLADCELVFLGDGPELAQLKSMAGRPEVSSRVRVLGKVSAATLVDFYRGARATIIPSRSDSLPLVFSEAIQCGSPVIAYDTGDLGHFIRRFNLGRVVVPGDLQALSRALIDFVPANTISPTGREAALELLNPARAARKFQHAIRMFHKSSAGKRQKAIAENLQRGRARC